MNDLLPPERRTASDRRSFARLLRVLEGEAPPPLTGRSAKLLCVLTSQRVDAVLTDTTERVVSGLPREKCGSLRGRYTPDGACSEP